jgi:glycosyltransferase involved in cell wall biosynthesis
MKVYFNLRPGSRERMWDTAEKAKEIVEVLIPNIKQKSSPELYKNYTISVISKLKRKIGKYLINKQKVDLKIAKNADLIYMWGAISKNIDKPFIIEIDNPYCLTYYHKETLLKKKDKIKNFLFKAKKLTFLSEASKNHFLEIFGKEFENKSFVFYPYMDDNYKKVKNENKKYIDFLFIGLSFRGKGGIELLEAFHKLKNENIKLTFISNVPEGVIKKYSQDQRITFLSPMPRKKIFEEIYPKMDVMVFPSFYESFGAVILEALSFGLGVISINAYATPEMVVNGYNGALLHHPILKPEILNGKEIINCVDYHVDDFYKKYLNNNEFYYGLYKEIQESIQIAIENYIIWKENSRELFERKFSPKVWFENLKTILLA